MIVALLLPYSLFFASTLHVSDYVSYRDVFHANETLAPLLPRRVVIPDARTRGRARSRHLRALARWLPGVAQLCAYPRGALRGDIVSGISVCVVMIPSVLAYAELAGVRPQAGLYAALGAMVLYALFTSTRR